MKLSTGCCCAFADIGREEDEDVYLCLTKTQLVLFAGQQASTITFVEGSCVIHIRAASQRIRGWAIYWTTHKIAHVFAENMVG